MQPTICAEQKAWLACGAVRQELLVVWQAWQAA